MMGRNKVTVVGAGNVGATTAQRIADAELADVVMIDIVEGIPQGKGLDMLEACPVSGSDVNVIGTNDYKDTAGSDIVVITAGLPRKAGMSRDDLLKKNYDIVKAVTEASREATRPTRCSSSSRTRSMRWCRPPTKSAVFPKSASWGWRVFWTRRGCATFIAMELNVSVDNIHAFVLGGHGDDMVPLPRYSTVAGIPLPDLICRKSVSTPSSSARAKEAARSSAT